MNDQIKIIKLIIEIDKIVEDEYFDCDLYSSLFEEKFDNFSDKLNEIFDNGLNDNILNMINKLKYKNIFKIYNGEKYINNDIRIQIEKYIDDNSALYLDYEFIKDNIIDDYKLGQYIKDKSKLVDLVEYNEKVLLIMEGKYLTKELIETQILKSDFVSKVFLGIYGKNNDIYIYSEFYKDIKNIDNILFEQLEDVLRKDLLLYINSSKIVKQNKKIQELIVSIDKRMKSYII